MQRSATLGGHCTACFYNIANAHVKINTCANCQQNGQKVIFLEWSNSAKRLIEIFWAQTFSTRSLPGPIFFKPSVRKAYASSKLFQTGLVSLNINQWLLKTHSG